MSHYGSAQLSTKFSQLGESVFGTDSVFTPRPYHKILPFIKKDGIETDTPADRTTGAFGQQLRFYLHKNETLYGDAYLELNISAGTLAAPNTAAWVNNLGQAVLQEVIVRIGSTILQKWSGDFAALYKAVTKNPVDLEGYNALSLSNLPPGGAGEATRMALTTQAFTLYCPLEEMWYAQSFMDLWMPEAQTLELELRVTLRPLAQLIYSAAGTDPFNVQPAITSSFIRNTTVTLSSAEKGMRLKNYLGAVGLVQQFLDLEEVPNVQFTGTGGGGARTLRVNLDNIRMDSVLLMFCVREENSAGLGVSTNWRGDPTEYDATASTVTGAAVNTLVPITSFSVEANGKVLIDSQPELWNRARVRPEYFEGCSIAGPIYIVPFSLFPADRRNCTSSQAMSNLGKVELVIVLPDWAATQRRVDVWSHSRNIMQMRGGTIAKALN